MSSIPVQQTFVSRLKSRVVVAVDTMAFRFERPAAMSYKAGQFVEMTLSNPEEISKRPRQSAAENYTTHRKLYSRF